MIKIKNLHFSWAMIQPLPVEGFKFVKNVSKIDKDILEVDVVYPKHLHDLHSDLPFLPERMKIDKCNKLVCNLYDKKTMLFIYDH